MRTGSIEIVGGGPAGTSAALAALGEGREVRLVEKSRFPRHKVCGEFLSPEIAPLLERMKLWDVFAAGGPGSIRRVELHFPKTVKRSRLSEAAFGMSRYRFDQILWEAAVERGARVSREADEPAESCRVVASGRKEVLPRGDRLFGFKAHFSGPVNDAVELYFFDRAYVGVNPAEEGITNVCGIAPERLLKKFGFDLDAVVGSSRALTERIAPLTREMKWMTTGPLRFRNRFREESAGDVYLCGDALSFVDPFTGSGILSAVASGRMAGLAAARGVPAARHLQECRRLLGSPFAVSSLFREAVSRGWAETLAPLVPGTWLFHLTRPRVVSWSDLENR
ncbi:MAG TPA: FAD-dependent monooxygenase [Bryobacteraceae bacterium]|nr:FAD-dependent monooxygenase [Bryobacteraceae bacterium]